MALPIVPIQDYPNELTGQSNGRLAASVLAVQAGSSPTLTMCKTAMRSFLAMADAATSAGITLRVTSAPDSYRTLAVQTRIFAERYTTQSLVGQPSKTCNGIKYWLKRGEATAACPGTSNHGLGLADDIVLDSAGKTLAWLIAHEQTFGFSHELQSEPWHIRYTAGDAIPAATLAYEEDDMSAEAENQIKQVYAAIFNGGTSCGTIPPGKPTNSIVNKLDYLIERAKAGGAATGVDEAAIAAEVAAALPSAAQIAEAVADEEQQRMVD